MMNGGEEFGLNALIGKIKRYPEVLAIIVSGSHAKDAAKDISDIDIAVITENSDAHIEDEIGSMYSPIRYP